MPSWGAIAMIVFFFLVFGGAQAVVRLVEGRRNFQLEQLRERRRIAEAEAKEHELEVRRRELEYREALLELERFDRRTGAGPAGPGHDDDPAGGPGGTGFGGMDPGEGTGPDDPDADPSAGGSQPR